ncbi:TPA: hypothetical protein ACPEYO_004781 [Klebsiella pneumoniae]|uniref:Uncharacterized protein n=1 Tax=Klebsiella pneumoniae TaxID=573 RepID=A0A5D3JF96_KLEPN|nr:hypothetical protein [Klebsiella pneumoniae]ASC11213.1 hypothetical protein AM486_10405 [Klebsiella pneumoniae]NER56050.1 hypothetical protein [Klebsiella pneumoniae]NEW24893.1 hypothetical protein [Klebsiella pneumoniae]NPC26394.1 hypothetical protein [Klebsiella pneumoniae]TYL71838.1 hypothetical protein FXN67_27710 [Klebsiella pneumoniae]
MSVKTEAIKPAAEISLFDAFGPNVSEQVQAINRKAAELSMADMAQVMGVTLSSRKKQEVTAESEDILDLSQWLAASAQKYGVSFGMKAYTSVEVKKMHVPDFRQILPVSANMLHTYSPFGRTGLQGIHDLIGAVSSKLHHLQGVGVDESTFKILIRYEDAKTGAPRNDIVEAESTISPSPVTGSKVRVKKLRRKGHEMAMHALIAKK